MTTKAKKNSLDSSTRRTNGETSFERSGLESLRIWLTAGGLVVAAIALVSAAYGIHEQHEWNRRHFAAEMIREWNFQSNNHKAAIEQAFPRFFQKEGPIEDRLPLDLVEAKLIYRSTPADGSPLFETNDLLNPSSLTSNLKVATDPLPVYLRNQPTIKTRVLLEQYVVGREPSLELISSLTTDLNGLLKGTSLYEPQRFMGIRLSIETSNLIRNNPQEEKLIRANRMMLEDAYPTEIAKSQNKRPSLWETRNHCIALLNYFEFVATAWENQIADRNMIESSFRATILRWHRDLLAFMEYMAEVRKYEPWPPYNEWSQYGNMKQIPSDVRRFNRLGGTSNEAKSLP